MMHFITSTFLGVLCLTAVLDQVIGIKCYGQCVENGPPKFPVCSRGDGGRVWNQTMDCPTIACSRRDYEGDGTLTECGLAPTCTQGGKWFACTTDYCNTVEEAALKCGGIGDDVNPKNKANQARLQSLALICSLIAVIY